MVANSETAAETAGPAGTQALIVGCGGIGTAVLERWRSDERFTALWTVGRSEQQQMPGVHHLLTDHSDASIAACCDQLRQAAPALSRIVITLGTLHGEDYLPEKSLRDLNSDTLSHVHRINCVLPLLWVAKLAPLLRHAEDCRIAVLSARVGSIGDNSLGGWYSYRSAKAALNMGLQCAAIELARSARGVKLMAYHPGTVATSLSAPFQSRVPSGQLFSPQDAAQYLLEVLESHGADGVLSYLDWAGKSIRW